MSSRESRVYGCDKDMKSGTKASRAHWRGRRVLETMSAEEIRDVILASNPTYQAAFLSMFQGGISCGDFEYWNLHGWEDLEKDLEKGLKVIQVHLLGRMGRRSFHTYIGGDAVEAIRTYLPHRDEASEAFERSEKSRRDRAQKKEIPHVEREFTTAIFYNKFGAPITAEALRKYWFNQTVKLGLVEPAGDGNAGTRYGKNPHEMRHVFVQLIYSRIPSSVVEYFLGHVGDRSREHLFRWDEGWTRPQYEKALPYLQIISSDKPFSRYKYENFNSMLDELKRIQDMLKEVKER